MYNKKLANLPTVKKKKNSAGGELEAGVPVSVQKPVSIDYAKECG